MRRYILFRVPPRLATAPQLAARLYAIQLLDEVVVTVAQLHRSNHRRQMFT
jgi:hypothetical protein